MILFWNEMLLCKDDEWIWLTFILHKAVNAIYCHLVVVVRIECYVIRNIVQWITELREQRIWLLVGRFWSRSSELLT